MPQHVDLTSIHRFAFVSSSDPGAVGVYKAWVDSTTTPHVLKLRNSDNNGWILIGEVITGSNLGGGADVFKTRTNDALEFRTITPSATNPCINITETANEIEVSVDLVELAAQGFISTADTDFTVANISPGILDGSDYVADDGFYAFGANSGFVGTPLWQDTTPALITANQNNYAPGTNGYYFRFSTDASRNITGIGPTSPTDGFNYHNEAHLIVNVGSFNIVLKHDDALSQIDFRFSNSTGSDITLTPGQAADILYDETLSSGKWRVWKRN